MKKAIFYSLDAALALVLVVGLIVYISSFPLMSPPVRNLAMSGNDFLNALSAITVEESSNPLIIKMINDSKISERQKDSSLLEFISELWAENDTVTANLIISNLTKNIISEDLGLEFSIEGDTLFSQNPITSNLSSAASIRIITGVSSNHTVRGVSAKTYITGIANKVTSEFVFFGGFVGQGNISKNGALLPNDANITDMDFEVALNKNFTLYVNGNFCQDLFDSGLNSTMYELSTCIGDLNVGTLNNFELLSSSNEAYIGGGVIEVKYKTQTLSELNNETNIYLPGVNGLINIYSSIMIPGNLTEMDIHLDYFVDRNLTSNATFYMNIGNISVYQDQVNNLSSIILDDTLLSSLLNYSDMKDSTIPIRIGFDNISNTISYEGGNADIVLITDLSGSMQRCVNSNNACSSGCAGSTCRFDLAKELGKSFVNDVLASPGNKISLVTYSTNADLDHSLSEDEVSLNSTIDSFLTGGATCICCSIREARKLLQSESNSSRNQYVVLMTDGIGNIECDNTDLDDTNGCSYFWCGGAGWCGCPHYKSNCGGCMTNDATCGDYLSTEARNDAIFDTEYLKNSTNATLNSIGFGAGAISCNYATSFLEDIAIVGGGNNYSSSDISELSLIYSSIAQQIVSASRVSQIISISGGNISSKLFDTSYIHIKYDPTFENTQGYLTIKKLSDPFGSCSANFDLPNTGFTDASVTSFSSEYWTDILNINSNNVFNLSVYSSDYSSLGDPFVMNVPSNNLVSGSNSVYLNIGDSPTNSSGCSPNSRIAYTSLVSTSIPQGGIYDSAEGCLWEITYDDLTKFNLTVPNNYLGSKICNFSSLSLIYDSDDAIDNAVYSLLTNLDVDSDGNVDVKIDENGFNIETIQVNEIPNLIGPSNLKLRLWQ